MKKVFLWWLIAGSKGGENRGRIILELNKRPYIPVLPTALAIALVFALLGIYQV